MEPGSAFGRALQRLIERIPFYPLSALSMLLGCYTLNNALALRPGQTGKLLVLLFTLNLYEALLIGLGLFLIRRRGLLADGQTLLFFEALFLADVTLLAGECFASSFVAGLLVSGAAFLLALLKAGVVFRALGPGMAPRRLLALAAPTLLLFATPGAFALLAALGLMGPVAVYVAWWVSALTVFLLALDARIAASEPASLSASASRFRGALAYALPISLMLHVGGAAWVHHVDFGGADLGPVLVALGVGRLLVDVEWMPAAWQYRFPLLAVLFSLGAPDALLVHGPLGLTLSPLRAVLGAIGMAYLLTYPIHRSVALAVASGAGLVLGAAGHSLTAMATNVGWLVASLGEGGTNLVPTTAMGWGVLAVVLAFVFLGLGAAASLWKPREEAPPPEEEPPKNG